jgi:hypothetical protein
MLSASIARPSRISDDWLPQAFVIGDNNGFVGTGVRPISSAQEQAGHRAPM